MGDSGREATRKLPDVCMMGDVVRDGDTVSVGEAMSLVCRLPVSVLQAGGGVDASVPPLYRAMVCACTSIFKRAHRRLSEASRVECAQRVPVDVSRHGGHE